MRYTVHSVTQLCLLVIGICASGILSSQHLDGVSYFVKPSCDSPQGAKPTQEGQFFYQLEIRNITTDSHYEVIVDGESLTQFQVRADDIPFTKDVGPFRHSGAGGSYHQYILRSLDTEVADTLFLAEVVCGFSTDQGLNRPGYYCNGLNAGVIAQATPEGLSEPAVPEKMYTYVLINRETQLVVAKNFSGHFDDVGDIEDYEIHAFASSFEESADFVSSITIGEPLDQADLVICHAFCGVFEVMTDCSSFDLRLQKDVVGTSIHSFGDTVTFDITVINEGRITAYNVEVRDDVPQGLIFEPDLNPFWEEDLTSKVIDSIAVGQAVTIPIRLIVDASSGIIDLVNVAEIINGTAHPDNTTNAFDVDSNPDNSIEDEDDQDDAEITVIENLCNSTFFVSLDKEPSCPGENIVLSPMVIMANEPVVFRWRYNGSIISRERELVLSPEEVDPHGVYQLAAIDNMGCVTIKDVPIDLIDNENRFSCYTDLNVGIDEDCKLKLRPEMFTGRPVSGIEDYLIEIRNPEGVVITEDEIPGYPEGTVFEARIINPCNGGVVCWTNLHVENKSIPSFTYYNYGVHETMCTSSNATPTSLIDQYNRRAERRILSADQFEEELNQTVCAQSWSVSIIDDYLATPQSCEDISVIRIYQVFDQEVAITIDTAYLNVKLPKVEDVLIPIDIDNISCGANIDPLSLGSFPYINIGGDTVYIETNALGDFEQPICGLGIKYEDQQIGTGCIWGAKKIQRTWTVGDWCDGKPKITRQFLYIIDREDPQLIVESDTIYVVAPAFTCHATIRPSDFVNATDNCTGTPEFLKGGEDIELPIGMSSTEVTIADGCSNQVSHTLVFIITESTPPIPILNKEMTLSFGPDTINVDHYVLADVFDAGSHDSDCGPVTLSIARWSEVDIIDRNGGNVSINDELHSCNPVVYYDTNQDGKVDVNEIFRDRIDVCCQDIGRTIKVLVKVADLSGNEAISEAYIDVVTKQQWVACDDGNDCTIDDREYGDCGCQGSPEIRDVDRDNVIDCNDDVIVMCLDGLTINVTYDHLDSMLNIGAIGGKCITNNDAAAMIAGEIYTPVGAMLSGVEVSINAVIEETTDVDGAFVFVDKEMNQRYELIPNKDDDHLNGVTALDLVLLQEHLLGLRNITDPYQLIAADVNSDGKISGQDVVDMQKLLLGHYESWRNNKSWRFVIEDYEWDDITKPWTYEEVNVISSLEEDMMDEDWIAIKTGDLSGDVITNNQKSKDASNGIFAIEVADQIVQRGDVVKVRLHSRTNQEKLRALQLYFAFDDLGVLGINSGEYEISADQFYIPRRDDGELQFIWTGELNSNEFTAGLFEIEFVAQADGKLSELLSLNRHASQLAYHSSDIPMQVQLDFIEGVAQNAVSEKALMYQNQPNPFTGQTVIQFVLPNPGRVQFEFYSAGGSLLLSMDQEYGAGNNAISLSHEDLRLYSGAVYYQMIYNQEKITRTMIVGK